MCLYLPEDTIWRDAEDSNKGGYLWMWVNGTNIYSEARYVSFYIVRFLSYVNGLPTQNVDLKKNFKKCNKTEEEISMYSPMLLIFFIDFSPCVQWLKETFLPLQA